MAFWEFGKREKRIYLDHAAATPVREEVLAEMAPYFGVHFGNPSAIHAEGLAAREAVEHSRERAARALGVRSRGVLFTGNGTEGNNLAIYGTLRAHADAGRDYASMRVITTAIEHPSILEPLRELAARGLDVAYCPVDAGGRIDERAFEALLTEETVLVAFAYVNSEVGVVQDVKRLTRTVRKFNETRGTNIVVHLDAAQAPLWLPVKPAELGADLLSLDAGKCCGPKGAGMLVRRGTAPLAGIMRGGGQEFGLRAGTENTPLIVGSAGALERAQGEWRSRSAAAAALRERMIDAFLSEIDGSVVNGSREHRVANNINISIPGVDSEFAVISLDAHGVAASTKSACEGAKSGGSEVVRVISGDEERARSTIRFTLGEETTAREIETAVRVLKEHVTKTRSRK